MFSDSKNSQNATRRKKRESTIRACKVIQKRTIHTGKALFPRVGPSSVPRFLQYEIEWVGMLS